MKFVIIFVGICLVQSQRNIYKLIPYYLKKDFPDHPYFRLGNRTLSAPNNLMIDQANIELVNVLSKAKNEAHEKSDMAIITFYDKRNIMVNLALDRFKSITENVLTELKELAESGENAKHCVDSYQNELVLIIDIRDAFLRGCIDFFNLQSDNIQGELILSYNSAAKYIDELGVSYKTCFETYRNNRNVIRCSFFQAMEFHKKTVEFLYITKLTNEMFPLVITRGYNCLLDSLYNTELELAAHKRDVDRCIKRN